MEIYIPTLGRGPDAQISYHKIAPALRGDFPVTIVCPHAERDAFKAAGYPVMSHDVVGLGATRQWIMAHATHNSVVMVDDDFGSWSYRPDPNAGRYKKATDVEIRLGFYRLAELLKDYANAGIGPRLFANHMYPVEYCRRVNGVVGLRKDILEMHELEFIQCPEDLEMTVQLLRAGYASATDFCLVYDQAESNAPGGCSTYRTPQFQAEAVAEFVSLHKDYVRATDKAPKSGWFNGQPRKDVAVRWQKLVREFDPQPISRRTGPVPCRTRDLT